MDIPAPFLDNSLHVIGQGRGEVHLPARHGMPEAQCLGMEYLSGAKFKAIVDESLIGTAPLPTQNLVAPISLVKEEGMANVLHVGTYLVGPTGFEDAFYQRGISETLHHAIMGDGGLAYLGVGREHRHTQTVLGVTGDVALYAPAILGEVAPHQGKVTTVSGLVPAPPRGR